MVKLSSKSISAAGVGADAALSTCFVVDLIWGLLTSFNSNLNARDLVECSTCTFVCVLLTWVCLCLCSLMSNHLGWCFYLKRFTTIIVTSTLEQPEVKGIVHTNICSSVYAKSYDFFFIYKSRYCGECSHWSFTIWKDSD